MKESNKIKKLEWYKFNQKNTNKTKISKNVILFGNHTMKIFQYILKI